ncbi:hypothetical protein L2Y96_12890 [Luteibacter aegosomaticola]|uniref:hypothetical protein n=1 Tax=Luteibacter aegosomaticola TaxID=2911538 RepID=UPI001FF79C2F|nr:hypothetical protein [Luteibacter aegosomaticola]UPG88317.1 hypothetical protein L2Y96_12890 [Luteibacter aegosomaticola]
MNHLQVLFPRPWQIRRPVVTRYMETAYVDAFFRDGSLRLSSFRRFRQYADEVRGDGLEGRASQTWTHPDGGHSAIVTINGGRCFVLCGASSEGPAIAEAFGTDDGFRILDTVAFADVVSRHIPGFIQGVEGLCMYRDDVGLIKAMPQMFTEADEADPTAAFERFDKAIQTESVDSFFLKRLRYATQCEYRLIWMALGDEVDCIEIKCPEAIPFTERLTKPGTLPPGVPHPPSHA